MNKIKSVLIGVLLLGATVINAQTTVITTTITTNASGGITSITTTGAPPTSSGLFDIGKQFIGVFQNASNYAIAPYMSYGLKNHKVGGGILALYDFNNYVGAGLGIDYLGSFSLVSGNVELKAPLNLFSFTHTSFGTNFVTTPFVYSGLGTPIGGTGGSGVVTHIGAGLNIDVAKLWGGEFSVGGAYIDRQNAGPIYSGKYANLFLAWRKGF